MTHYIKLNGKNIYIEMGCNHLDQIGNSTEGIGCSGKCEECKHSIASTTIPEMMEMLKVLHK